MNNETSHERSTRIYKSGLWKVANTTQPELQKYAIGSRVKISGRYMNGMTATVKYVYAHAYGGPDVKSYCLQVDHYGEISWIDESELTQINNSVK